VLWSAFPEGEATHGNVVYVHGTRLRGWLERQRPELTQTEIARAANYLHSLDRTGSETPRRSVPPIA
jgi:hypothetical protein